MISDEQIDQDIQEVKDGERDFIIGPMCTIVLDDKLGWVAKFGHDHRLMSEKRVRSLLKHGM